MLKKLRMAMAIINVVTTWLAYAQADEVITTVEKLELTNNLLEVIKEYSK